MISYLHSGQLSSSVGRILITTSETELQDCNSFSLLLIQEVDSSLTSLGLMTALFLGLPPWLGQAAAWPEKPSPCFRVSRLLLGWPHFSAFPLTTVLISGLFSFHVAEDPKLAEVGKWGGRCNESHSAGLHTQP